VIDPDRLTARPAVQEDRALKAGHPEPGERRWKGIIQVYYFATGEEYASTSARLPGCGAKVSLRQYVSARKESKESGGISYFFNDVGGQLTWTSNLYQRTSHQLLFESAGPDNYIHNAGITGLRRARHLLRDAPGRSPTGGLRVGGMVGPRIAQARRVCS